MPRYQHENNNVLFIFGSTFLLNVYPIKPHQCPRNVLPIHVHSMSIPCPFLALSMLFPCHFHVLSISYQCPINDTHLPTPHLRIESSTSLQIYPLSSPYTASDIFIFTLQPQYSVRVIYINRFHILISIFNFQF